jgi:hypothetical protein
MNNVIFYKKNIMKKKVYISGPITGLVHSIAFKNFSAAASYLRNSIKAYPVNPMSETRSCDLTWREHMQLDIVLLMKCDCIYMLKNWEKSRGAKIEHELAIGLDMPVIYQ